VTFAVHAMTVSSARTPATRAPDNELYDRGCDLVEAARGPAPAPFSTERALLSRRGWDEWSAVAVVLAVALAS
jgi:hypothetical protein